MRTIGIRAKPTAFTFAIFDTTENRVVNVENVLVPVALSVPDALRYVRSTVLDILREYDATQGCIRVTEPTAQSPDTRRIQMEGVIQESFASSSLGSYFVGQISNISARIGFPRSDFKLFVSGEKTYTAIEDWGQFSTEEREAIFAALGAAHA